MNKFKAMLGVSVLALSAGAANADKLTLYCPAQEAKSPTFLGQRLCGQRIDGQ